MIIFHHYLVVKEDNSAQTLGDLAHEIIAVAAEYVILKHEDPKLLEVLNQFDIGERVLE